jgi:hypothetical protein
MERWQFGWNAELRMAQDEPNNVQLTKTKEAKHGRNDEPQIRR